jgi:hypothetical protein
MLVRRIGRDLLIGLSTYTELDLVGRAILPAAGFQPAPNVSGVRC